MDKPRRRYSIGDKFVWPTSYWMLTENGWNGFSALNVVYDFDAEPYNYASTQERCEKDGLCFYAPATSFAFKRVLNDWLSN